MLSLIKTSRFRAVFSRLSKLPLLLVALFAACAPHAVQSAPEPPNIIVIFTDDQGWPDLGAQGILDDIRTPHLDKLAGDGVRFTSGYITAPQCIPSRAGLVSGTYQQLFGVDDNRFSPMPDEVLTVAERLKKAGYATGMVGKWHLDPNPDSEEWLKYNIYGGGEVPPRAERQVPFPTSLPYRPANQGYGDFFEGQIFRYWANFDIEGNDLPEPGRLLEMEERDRLDIQTDAALAFLKRNHDKPFFLYLSYFAPHVPLESTEKYLSRFPGEMAERRRYALAMLSAVDDGVGAVREKLEEYGIADNTLIFYLSDNGAPLWRTMEDITLEHKGGAWDGSLNQPLRGEKGMLSEGGVRVPFLMAWPNEIEAGQVIDFPVSSLDVGATAVDVAGMELDDALSGLSLIDLLESPEKAQERPLFWRFWQQSAIRLGDWKYLRAGQYEFLFNIAEDMTESNNLIEQHPAKATALRKQLEAWEATLARPGESGDLRPGGEKMNYEFYFNVGDSQSSQKTTAPAHPHLPSWDPRFATIELTDTGMALIDSPNKALPPPFITANSLRVPGKNAELCVELNAEESGTGRIEFRYRDQIDFVPENTEQFEFEAGEQTICLAIDSDPSEVIEHFRLFLPFQEHDYVIKGISVSADGKEIYRWQY